MNTNTLSEMENDLNTLCEIEEQICCLKAGMRVLTQKICEKEYKFDSDYIKESQFLIQLSDSTNGLNKKSPLFNFEERKKDLKREMLQNEILRIVRLM